MKPPAISCGHQHERLKKTKKLTNGYEQGAPELVKHMDFQLPKPSVVPCRSSWHPLAGSFHWEAARRFESLSQVSCQHPRATDFFFISDIPLVLSQKQLSEGAGAISLDKHVPWRELHLSERCPYKSVGRLKHLVVHDHPNQPQVGVLVIAHHMSVVFFRGSELIHCWGGYAGGFAGPEFVGGSGFADVCSTNMRPHVVESS